MNILLILIVSILFLCICNCMNHIDNYSNNDVRKIFILASDTDYIQLCDSNVILIDMNNNFIHFDNYIHGICLF